MTIEELGQQTKAKYPVYANIPDAELGQKVLVKYPQYQSQITDKKKLNPVAEFLMGRAIRVAQDIGTALSPEQAKARESQQAALDMQSRLDAMARNASPEAQRRLNAVSADTNRVVGQGARDIAGSYSEDVMQDPLTRGLNTGADVANTAGLVSGAYNLFGSQPQWRVGEFNKFINNAQTGPTKAVIPDLLKKGGSGVKALFNFQKNMSLAREKATQLYSDVDVMAAKRDVLQKLAHQLSVDTSKAANASADEIMKSLNNANNVSDILERTVQWNSHFAADGSIKSGAKDLVYAAAQRSLKKFLVDNAPEVAKYTKQMYLSHEIPKQAFNALKIIGATAGGLAGIKYLLSGGSNNR